jgi:hypothetical protein
LVHLGFIIRVFCIVLLWYCSCSKCLFLSSNCFLFILIYGIILQDWMPGSWYIHSFIYWIYSPLYLPFSFNLRLIYWYLTRHSEGSAEALKLFAARSAGHRDEWLRLSTQEYGTHPNASWTRSSPFCQS